MVKAENTRFTSSFSKACSPVQKGISKRFLSRIEADIFSSSHWHLSQQIRLFDMSSQYGRELAQEGQHLVVCGIGGSGLGVRAFAQWILPVGQGSRVEVLDHLDPQYLEQWLSTLSLSDCVFCVTSKSGKTLETLSVWMLLYQRLKAMGFSEAQISRKTVFISSPEKNPLTRLAAQTGYRIAHIPPGVGGRFSVLTPVGLIPLAFMGEELGEVRAAMDAEWGCFQKSLSHLQKSAESESVSSALSDAARLLSLVEAGRLNQWILMAYSKKFFGFMVWAAQLIAESLGKDGKGILPLPAQGVTDQHSYLQYIMQGPSSTLTTFFEFPFEDVADLKLSQLPAGGSDPFWRLLQGQSIAGIHHIECQATRQACDASDRATQRIRFDRVGLFELSRWVVYFQQLIASLGLMMGINPYDQPGVELGKQEALKRLSQQGER